MASIKFLKGTQANLNEITTPEVGAMYFTTDSHRIYMGTDSGLQEYSAVEVVESISALPAVNAAIPGKFYYATGDNCFCFLKDGAFQQVNPDTGMTSVEVTGSGNAISSASYSAATRKLTLNKDVTYTTAVDVDGKIADKVGELKIGETDYATVKAYVDQKTSGIATDASLTALTNRVGTAEGKITALETANAEGGAVANAIADAKKAGTDAATAAGQVAADVTAINDKIGTVTEGKTVVQMISEAASGAEYDDTEVRGLITDNADDISTVSTKLDTFLAAADVGEAAIDTLKEIQDYITADGTAAAEMTANISANATAIAAETTRATAAEQANATAASEAKTAAQTAQTDVNAIKADYLKAADKTALQGSIDTLGGRVTAIEDKNISNGANKVESSTNNGKIKIDGVETTVYTHPATHAISEVSGLQDALDAKQDELVFNTPYNATSNKVATMTDVNTTLLGMLTWAEF